MDGKDCGGIELKEIAGVISALEGKQAWTQEATSCLRKLTNSKRLWLDVGKSPHGRAIRNFKDCLGFAASCHLPLFEESSRDNEAVRAEFEELPASFHPQLAECSKSPRTAA